MFVEQLDSITSSDVIGSYIHIEINDSQPQMDWNKTWPFMLKNKTTLLYSKKSAICKPKLSQEHDNKPFPFFS